MKNKTLIHFMFIAIISASLLYAEKPSQQFDNVMYSNHIRMTNVVKSQSEVHPETERQIKNTLRKTQANIMDVNEDGKKNCVDHAILFYLVWSTYVDSTPGNCILVHNYRPGIMNHLFVQVKDIKTGKFVEVEPWTVIPKDYIITRCWKKETYDYRYNIYNETEKWLGQIKKRVLLLEVFR